MTQPNTPPAERSGRELWQLAQYFTPGYPDRIIRTWVPIGLGYLLSWVALHYAWLGLPDHPSTTFSLGAAAAVTAAYYALGTIIERKWPKAGRVLISLGLVRSQPVYAPPETAQAVDNAASAVALRRSMS